MNTIWQSRWSALDAQLQSMLTQYAATPNPVNNCLHALTDSLQTFGADQFNFFWDGFDTGQLLPAMMIPEEHVLRATLDQVAFDINLIQRIFEQRQQTALTAKLTKADELAQAALDVAVQSGLLPQCGVLTYFNKSANIRIIPYAPIALVGVPYTATTADLDFLAIPHEVAHYVYHHAPGLAANLHNLIPLYPDWVNHWTEEIFADVFGAQIAGPIMGYSFQQLLLDNAQEKFVADDGEHPPDAVRPYGCNQALRQLGYTKAADKLDETWASSLAQRHYPAEFTPRGSSTPASLADAQQIISQTADLFVDYVVNVRQVTQASPWTSDTNNLATLEQDFLNWLAQSLQVDHYLLTAVGSEVGVATGGGTAVNLRAKGSTQTWRDWLKEDVRNNSTVLIPAQAWLPIFTAGHWPVKGPESNSNGGI